MVVSLDLPHADATRRRDTMTSAHRLRAALDHRPPDRVPISFKGVDPFYVDNPRLVDDPNLRALMDIVRRHGDVQHDWRYDLRAPIHALSDDARIEEQTANGGTEVLTTLTTRRGCLTQRKRLVHGTDWTLKPLIETEADVETYLAHDWAPLQPDLASFWREAERLGDRGLMRIQVRDPIGAVAPLVDRETFYIWMATKPELLDRLHEALFERLLATVEYLAQAGVRCLVQFGGAEYAAPPMASPVMFDRYVARFGEPMTRVLRAHGCTPMLHCHASVGGLLERFCSMGYAATHPVEPPPMGDVRPEDFKTRVGDRLTMIGNVQIGEMLAGDADVIRGWVRDLIDVMGHDGGLVLCDSATPWERPMKDVTLRNYIALIEAAHEFGRAA